MKNQTKAISVMILLVLLVASVAASTPRSFEIYDLKAADFVFTINGSGSKLQTGTYINEYSIDGTLADNSDDAVPTEQAVKTYVDSVSSDYCANGLCNGSLEVIGNFTVVGEYVNLNVTTQNVNGSIYPSLDSLFDLGTSLLRWNRGFFNSIFADDWSDVNISHTQVYDFNTTVQTLAEVKEYEENISVSVSGGVGEGKSSVTLDFEITRITVTSPNPTSKYRFEAVEDSDGTIIDKDRTRHTGTWDIQKSHAINNDYVNVSITDASDDGTYNVKITYLDNFRGI